MLDNIKAWVFGVGVVFVMGRYVFPYLQSKVPKLLTGYIGPRLLAAMKGGGATDDDLARFIKQITYAVVVLAEAKFPDKGVGKQKFDWVYYYLSTAFPIMAPFLEDYGMDLAKIINESVMQMDKQFKDIKDLGEKAPVIMMLPEVPAHRLEE